MNTITSIQYLLLKLRINRLRESVLKNADSPTSEKQIEKLSQSLLKIARFCKKYGFSVMYDKALECERKLVSEGLSASLDSLFELFEKTQELSDVINNANPGLPDKIVLTKENHEYTNIAYSKIPNILILRDGSDDFKIQQELDTHERYKIYTAFNISESITIFEERKPDLILLQNGFKSLSGVELLQVVRNTPYGSTIPILYLSQDASLDSKLSIFNAGADDYIVIPFNVQELIARINAFLARTALLRELALNDELTGLYNRQYMYEKLSEEISRWRRYKRPFALMVVDLDGLKEINDTYGHMAGDLLIRGFAFFLKSQLSHTDIVTRFGGDEFVVILPETTLAEAEQILLELYTERAKVVVPVSKAELPINFCVGVSGCPDDGEDGDTLISIADKMLYKAKDFKGKNNFVTTAQIREGLE